MPHSDWVYYLLVCYFETVNFKENVKKINQTTCCYLRYLVAETWASMQLMCCYEAVMSSEPYLWRQEFKHLKSLN